MPIDDIMRKTGAAPRGERATKPRHQQRRSGLAAFNINYEGLANSIKLDNETASLLADVVSILVNLLRLLP